MAQSRPMRTSAPITALGADHRAGADLGARPDDGAGIDGDAVLEAGRRMHEGTRRDALRAEGRGRAHGGGKEERQHLREDPVGLRRDEGDRRLPAPSARSGARRDRPRPGSAAAPGRRPGCPCRRGRTGRRSQGPRRRPAPARRRPVGQGRVRNIRHLTQGERPALRKEIGFRHRDERGASRGTPEAIRSGCRPRSGKPGCGRRRS